LHITCGWKTFTSMRQDEFSWWKAKHDDQKEKNQSSIVWRIIVKDWKDHITDMGDIWILITQSLSCNINNEDSIV
jgi:hypothetical protein